MRTQKLSDILSAGSGKERQVYENAVAISTLFLSHFTRDLRHSLEDIDTDKETITAIERIPKTVRTRK